ncbi:MAG: DNA-directed RNA polymerase subunit beta' [Lachnospiraceae bacterium]|nr:DNA-directed RNA polymerase subunit beta' [Lachnospiraceae bacterium]
MSLNVNDNTNKGNYNKIRINLASPEKIREWSRGDAGVVTKAETINYRTLKFEKDGLFCEKIFGPHKDWECYCGKYKKVRYKGKICEKCGVEVTKSSVRRERMGRIELEAPVVHFWYYKNAPSKLSQVLDIPVKQLEKVIYFSMNVVTDPGTSNFKYKQIVSDEEVHKAVNEYGKEAFSAKKGAEAIKELLEKVDLEDEAKKLREEFEKSKGQKKEKIVKRLDILEAFIESGNNPAWMVLDCVPVLPPDLRPIIQLDGGRQASADLTELYRKIIIQNNRLHSLLTMFPPATEGMINTAKSELQRSVDALLDNEKTQKPRTNDSSKRVFKSLSEKLRGKQGYFRQNLLGKRVDYSGRSVIVVGPELKIYQCGLPKEMAIELFKPFVQQELVSRGAVQNIKSAKKMVDSLDEKVWDVLEDVIKEHPVMLNRAPSLHRLSIQAFEPVLVEGKAIKLHPLVCTGFNADFDGDQMAVHVPLSVEAQAECRFLLLSPNNLLKPSDGGLVAVPSQDMVLGIYYLTMEKPEEEVEDGLTELERRIRNTFKDANEAILAYENGQIKLQTPIWIRRDEVNENGNNVVIKTTVGRWIFNEIIPQDLGLLDRSKPENKYELEVNYLVDKKQVKKILEACIRVKGITATAEILDKVKAMGYKYSTRAAMTVSIADMKVPEEKPQVLADAEKKIADITKAYRRGRTTDDLRYKAVVSVWEDVDKIMKDSVYPSLGKYNNIYIMAASGARGSQSQIKQLVGWRGLMQDTTGKVIELPIKSNLCEGLDVLEYFISAHGARKGLSDTALRTADSGYLTRRLVDVSQEIVIRELDCSKEGEEIPGMEVKAFYDLQPGKDKPEMIEPFIDRIRGRVSCEKVYDDNGNLIVDVNELITVDKAEAICKTKKYHYNNDDPSTYANLNAKLKIRTALTCRTLHGVCAKCYGVSMATNEEVQIGESVGIIAAQSIGEPGTQLTMRTFHTGGVAGSNITQGLPRVEELFEARQPKGSRAILSEFEGIVSMKENTKKKEVVVTAEDGTVKTYTIPYDAKLKVAEGDRIGKGESLTEGNIKPEDLMNILGPIAVQDYLLKEVLRVYRLQSVEINDKHIEIPVRQMLRHCKIEESGDSNLLTGKFIDLIELSLINEKLIAEGKQPAVGKQILQGITKAALKAESFLAAASFQETSKVLTDAAVRGKEDPLLGIKENVIIGKLIPAGTGLKKYRDVTLDTDQYDYTEPYDGDYSYDDPADTVSFDMNDFDDEEPETDEFDENYEDPADGFADEFDDDKFDDENPDEF